MGAIVESVLGRSTTDDDKIRLEKFLRGQEQRGKYFSKAMNDSDDSVESDDKDEPGEDESSSSWLLN